MGFTAIILLNAMPVNPEVPQAVSSHIIGYPVEDAISDIGIDNFAVLVLNSVASAGRRFLVCRRLPGVRQCQIVSLPESNDPCTAEKHVSAHAIILLILGGFNGVKEDVEVLDKIEMLFLLKLTLLDFQ